MQDPYPLAAAELQRARDNALNNVPIYEANGDEEQAQLCAEVAVDCMLALRALQRLEPPA